MIVFINLRGFVEKLIAYHGKQSVKNDILAQLKAHYAADEIIQGTYWQNGKGCAVGCTIHSNDHSEYESRFGIPRILARLKDGIFEGLPNNLAKEWPIKFMSAINVGADLSKVWPKFAVWLLTDEKYGVLQYAKTNDQKNAIQKISDMYARNDREKISGEDWLKATHAVTATATPDAYAATATAYAAYAADYTASDYAATDAAAAAAYAKKNHQIAQSKKLLELLELLEETKFRSNPLQFILEYLKKLPCG